MPYLPTALRKFDPERKVYAQRPINLGDFILDVGEELLWKELELSQATVQMWFNLRMISHFVKGDFSEEAARYYRGEPEPTPEVAEPTSDGGKTPEDDVDPEPIPEPAPATPVKETRKKK
jgi:hypothetical protein